MADLIQLLSGEEEPAASYGRFVDIIQSFCGDECERGELVVTGTGEVIEFINKNHRDIDNGDATDLISENIELLPSPNISSSTSSKLNYVSLLAAFITLLLVLALAFRYYLLRPRPRDSASKKQTLHSSKQHTSVDVDNKTKHGEGQAVDCGETHSQNMSPALLVKSMTVACAIETELSSGAIPDLVKENLTKHPVKPHPTASGTDNPTTSSLEVYSEGQLRECGKEIARNMTLIMSEFETTMKSNGYNVSQSESLAIASQQLMSMEALRLSTAAEARQYLYDSQQRNFDRSVAECRHAESIHTLEQDKDWFQKIQAARDECVKSIQPGMQRSFLFLGLCYLVYYLFEYRDLLSINNASQFLLQTADEINGYRNAPGTGRILIQNNQAYDVNLSAVGLFTFVRVVSPLLQSFFRLWIFVLLPVLVVSCYVAAQFLLPTVVMECAKTVGVAWIVVCMLSSVIPWKSLCIGQLAFWVLAQIWTRLLFDRAIRELKGLESCPTSKELLHHMSAFDQTAHLMTCLACMLNGVVVLWSLKFP